MNIWCLRLIIGSWPKKGTPVRFRAKKGHTAVKVCRAELKMRRISFFWPETIRVYPFFAIPLDYSFVKVECPSRQSETTKKDDLIGLPDSRIHTWGWWVFRWDGKINNVIWWLGLTSLCRSCVGYITEWREATDHFPSRKSLSTFGQVSCLVPYKEHFTVLRQSQHNNSTNTILNSLLPISLAI